MVHQSQLLLSLPATALDVRIIFPPNTLHKYKYTLGNLAHFFLEFICCDDAIYKILQQIRYNLV